MNNEWQLRNAFDLEFFRGLVPEEVLIDVGEPWLFTSRAEGDCLVIAYVVTEVDDPRASGRFVRRHVVSPSAGSQIAALKAGNLSIRDCLVSTWMWVVDKDEGGQVCAAYNVSVDDLPNRTLPDGPIMLNADLQPELVVRLVGPDIRTGHVPASVIEAAGESVLNALRPLATHAAGKARSTSGRRPNWLARVYNLPAQRVAFSSFEVAFRRAELARPDSLFSGDEPAFAAQDRDVDEEMWRLLRRGLALVSDGDGTLIDDGSMEDRELEAILTALKELSPSNEAVQEVHVGGALGAFGSVPRAYKLTRDTSASVRRSLRDVRRRLQDVAEVRLFTGRVRELDLDRRSFYLRDIQGEEDVREEPQFIVARDDDFELAREVFDTDVYVIAAGARSRLETTAPWSLLLIDFAPDIAE